MSIRKSAIESGTGTAIRGIVNWSLSFVVYPLFGLVGGSGTKYLGLTIVFTISSLIVGTAVTHGFRLHEKRSKLHRLAKMERLIAEGKDEG